MTLVFFVGDFRIVQADQLDSIICLKRRCGTYRLRCLKQFEQRLALLDVACKHGAGCFDPRLKHRGDVGLLGESRHFF